MLICCMATRPVWKTQQQHRTRHKHIMYSKSHYHLCHYCGGNNVGCKMYVYQCIVVFVFYELPYLYCIVVLWYWKLYCVIRCILLYFHIGHVLWYSMIRFSFYFNTCLIRQLKMICWNCVDLHSPCQIKFKHLIDQTPLVPCIWK